MDRPDTLPMFDSNGFTTDEMIATALAKTVARALFASMYLAEAGKTTRTKTVAQTTEIHLKDAVESLIPILGRANVIRIIDSVQHEFRDRLKNGSKQRPV